MISTTAKRLAGARALVTGGAKGIGRAIAQRLAHDGASVAILDLDEGLAASVARSIEHDDDAVVVGYGADVRQSDAVNEAIERAATDLGGLDIVVNNAGVARDGRLADMSDDDWDLVLNTDLRGYFLCARAALGHLQASGRGRIINISSRAHLGNPGQANYSAAKAGVIGLTRALSLELGADAITVNAIAPGLIDTEFVRAHPKADKIIERAIKSTPVGRIGTPEDIAAVVAFLASPDASYISGEVIHVTGGRY